MKSARRRARECAMQAIYAWQLSGAAAPDLLANAAESGGLEQADRAYFRQLVEGVLGTAEALRDLLAPGLDRPWKEVSPIERAILLIAGWELSCAPQVPYRAVINEAVEVAKEFGGTNGHKYVNGVLDRVAKALRPAEPSRT
ncbi:MAG: transcription antitermination factor NusB [Burkholderiales bacterium]|nr:transcription antitermination factor NusB [Burkholderiales bacterium]